MRARAAPVGCRDRSREALRAEIDVNAALNTRTAGLGPMYHSHRTQVMRLLREAASACGAAHLVILGAGNCNDVDLSELLGIYDEVSLVDIDATAMERAACQLSSGQRLDLRRHAADVAVPTAGVARHVLGARSRGASVVLSATILTQLIVGALDAPSSSVELGLGRVGSRMRWLHLCLIMRLLAPGGRGILVTDVVSTANEGSRLRDVDEHRLAAYLAQCCSAGNYFAGTRPGDVVSDIATLPGVDRGSLRRSAPWIWRLEDQCAYLVYAAAFRRVGGAGSRWLWWMGGDGRRHAVLT